MYKIKVILIATVLMLFGLVQYAMAAEQVLALTTTKAVPEPRISYFLPKEYEDSKVVSRSERIALKKMLRRNKYFSESMIKCKHNIECVKTKVCKREGWTFVSACLHRSGSLGIEAQDNCYKEFGNLPVDRLPLACVEPDFKIMGKKQAHVFALRQSQTRLKRVTAKRKMRERLQRKALGLRD